MYIYINLQTILYITALNVGGVKLLDKCTKNSSIPIKWLIQF